MGSVGQKNFDTLVKDQHDTQRRIKLLTHTHHLDRKAFEALRFYFIAVGRQEKVSKFEDYSEKITGVVEKGKYPSVLCLTKNISITYAL